ncbi:sulfite oxidase [Robbsia sp. Bb-Pol-6]|uniref:Sulfite oxidase n=1 Tax=Robbsia betulipollinis TaxID=2981849 RepID=A0ABT3ZSJ3_9BURK|nr:sulfite oxidase [Robbsia betulipollinis]MCY0389516.1 sulfite oxidase [Robbsia betulipollinis]
MPQLEPRIVHSANPYNAEPRLGFLRTWKLTPADVFYVRSHGDIPRPEIASFRVSVGGRVRAPLTFSLAQLRGDFTRHTVEAVLQCAGNRRSDLQAVKPVAGDPWAGGAIGNATWSGVMLADVLRAAGAECDPALHVAFDSLDDCHVEGHAFRYGVSIPMSKANSAEVLLAYDMNGAPLTAEHGAPLRAIVPGYAGVRSAKWLTAITVQESPSTCYIQSQDYKLFPPDATPDTANPAQGMTINDMPLNSVICEPADRAVLAAGKTTLRGWAIATARGVARVDVSINGGRDWSQARLEHDAGSPWSWTLWEHEVEIPAGNHRLAVRAWDSAGQTQPADADDTWNYKGYLCASWHRIDIGAT